MFARDVSSDQLNVLRNVCLWRPDPGQTLLDVVEETLGQGGVLVQVDQMRSLRFKLISEKIYRLRDYAVCKNTENSKKKYFARIRNLIL